MRGHWFALQANDLFTKKKQKKIELVSRPGCPQCKKMLYSPVYTDWVGATFAFYQELAPKAFCGPHNPKNTSIRLQKYTFLHTLRSLWWTNRHNFHQISSKIIARWNFKLTGNRTDDALPANAATPKMLRADNATFLLFESDISWIFGIFLRYYKEDNIFPLINKWIITTQPT